MSARITPITGAAPKRQRSATKPKPVPAAQLSDLEIRFALAFRNFKPESKLGWIETAEKIARFHQSEIAETRPERKLRLVSGGAR